jgi:hypothetical protein
MLSATRTQGRAADVGVEEATPHSGRVAKIRPGSSPSLRELVRLPPGRLSNCLSAWLPRRGGDQHRPAATGQVDYPLVACPVELVEQSLPDLELATQRGVQVEATDATAATTSSATSPETSPSGAAGASTPYEPRTILLAAAVVFAIDDPAFEVLVASPSP